MTERKSQNAILNRRRATEVALGGRKSSTDKGLWPFEWVIKHTTHTCPNFLLLHSLLPYIESNIGQKGVITPPEKNEIRVNRKIPRIKIRLYDHAIPT